MNRVENPDVVARSCPRTRRHDPAIEAVRNCAGFRRTVKLPPLLATRLASLRYALQLSRPWQCLPVSFTNCEGRTIARIRHFHQQIVIRHMWIDTEGQVSGLLARKRAAMSGCSCVRWSRRATRFATRAISATGILQPSAPLTRRRRWCPPDADAYRYCSNPTNGQADSTGAILPVWNWGSVIAAEPSGHGSL